MCLSTDTLNFLDITNYLAPGFSYEFFFESLWLHDDQRVSSIRVDKLLRQARLSSSPSKDAFRSQLKNEDISEEDYALCERVWNENNMTTFKDFLIWYNNPNRDVVPFLEAIDKQFAFYKERRIDMFKDGISVPLISHCNTSLKRYQRKRVSRYSMKNTKTWTVWLKMA